MENLSARRLLEESPKADFRLGEWSVSPVNGEIVGPRGTVHLEPRAMALLCALADQPGETIERETLLRRVWAGVVVNDEALTRTVHDLRHCLRDDRKRPRYIETVAKRGYRLVAPVKPVTEPAGPGSERRNRSRIRMHVRWALAIVIALAMLVYMVGSVPPRGRQTTRWLDHPAVAVLPFRNFSKDRSFDYFGDGIAEELLHQLARQPGLRVVARTSSFAFRGTKNEIPQIAGELGADAIVEGSVRQSGGRLRITAQLVDARGYHLWSSQIETSVGDLINAQAQIADRITRALAPHLSRSRAQHPGNARPPVNEVAMDRYLQARERMSHQDAQSLHEAVDLLHAAQKADPHFVRALGSEAMAWSMLWYFGHEPDEVAVHMAERAANRALSGDSSIAEAHLALAWVAVMRQQWRRAEEAVIAAGLIEPSNWRVENSYAGISYKFGRQEESLKHEQRARLLNPLSTEVLQDFQFFYFSYGDTEKLHETDAALAKLGADEPTWHLKYLAVREKRWKAARRLWQTVSEKNAVEPRVMDSVLAALAGTGDRAEALQLLRATEARGTAPDRMLLIGYAYLKSDQDLARLFHRMVHANDLTYLIFWWPEFAHFRGTPAFSNFAEEAGLAAYWDKWGGPEQCQRGTGGWVCN
ncbi:MAG: winged helix-turn-helix domain-containing protein [Gammaproteobacteria bacterium]|jgi:TolB-like protein/DNA-binding winged helix-turn-helix (wHTH) protein